MSARRVVEILTILAFAGGACTDAQLQAVPATLRVVVAFDATRGTPGSVNVISHSYGGNRTGDATGGPTAANSAGDTSANDTQQQNQAAQGATFTFPDKANLMQGAWSLSLNVTGDGTPLFSGTCPGLTLRSNRVLIVTFTEPPTGNTATCTSALAP